MKPPSPQAEYMDVVRDIIQKLFYQERLTFKNLEKDIQTDHRLSPMQRRKAETRLSFAQRWLCDEREYEWGDVLTRGRFVRQAPRQQALDGGLQQVVRIGRAPGEAHREPPNVRQSIEQFLPAAVETSILSLVHTDEPVLVFRQE